MATTKKPAANLSQLQKTLNTDTRMRNQFLKDPGGVLAKNGLELPPDKAEQLSQFTQQVTAAGGASNGRWHKTKRDRRRGASPCRGRGQRHRPLLRNSAGPGCQMRIPDLTFLPEGGDALIVVPPFAGLDRPSLAAHLLQACAREAGFTVHVLYANILLAANIGEINYEAVCYTPTGALLGERFFARAAYGVSSFGRDTGHYEAYFRRLEKKYNGKLKVDLDDLRKLEPIAVEWADAVASEISSRAFPVVGCTNTFEQTAASAALLNSIKRCRPDIVTIIGGANCEGQMAEGILSLGAAIDYVFSGESEVSFPRFLRELRKRVPPEKRIVSGEPCMDLDALPPIDYGEFYLQFQTLLPASALMESGVLWLPYETSRGCWWGEKHHCTFCGLNAQTMKHREKSPDRVIADLRALLEKHPTRRVCMVDNIMPHAYLRTLVPRLAQELPDTHISMSRRRT